MSEYTEMLVLKAETIDPDDDGYEESLLEIASYETPVLLPIRLSTPHRQRH